MPKLELVPSDDLTEVAITIDGTTIRANALQLDTLIEGFAAARAQLRPAVSNDAPLGQRVQAIADPRYWTNIDPDTGMSLVMFRHPGLGWLSFMLPPDERDRLAQFFTEQAKATANTATPGPAVH